MRHSVLPCEIAGAERPAVAASAAPPIAAVVRNLRRSIIALPPLSPDSSGRRPCYWKPTPRPASRPRVLPTGGVKRFMRCDPTTDEGKRHGHVQVRRERALQAGPAGPARGAGRRICEAGDRAIGRAACRERVSQYVSILVVAVSLIKQE